MDSPSEKTPELRKPSKYFGRHRQLPFSRTVFAAIAAATLIGSGLSAAVAADSPADDTVAVASAEREEQAQADRDAEREVPAESEAPEKDADPAETPDPKDAEAAPPPDWVIPSPAPISDVYGPRAWRGGEMHYGTDFAAAEGADNYAAADGTVVQAGSNGGYGLGITIEHANGVVTVYGHHSKLLVDVGDKVKAGDTIGLAGSTGDVTGPHLHFEVYVNGTPTDPVKFLKDKGVKI
ncbi:MAG TPA: peptidoglycan DD-metalloendopeptidase family protein [Candidatus Stackebrandtia excrementipullorum]|nr:peptidoglycan DD-metalloendopeptidase family protein [Candidatus Stackebrandtia excrementipullorum]